MLRQFTSSERADRLEEQFYLGLDPEAEVDYGLDPKQEASFPERLSQAIEAYGVGAVAKASGISRQHLSRIAKGGAKASSKLRSKLTCAILQLDSGNSR